VIDLDALVEASRGHYQSFEIQLVDDITNGPLDLTGWQLTATVRERGKTPLLLVLGTPKIAAVLPREGKITIIIDEIDSKLLPSRDRTHYHHHHHDCPTHTCVMQITGITQGRNYLLATIGIDNHSSTTDGETP
jgi:hypothetical protein